LAWLCKVTNRLAEAESLCQRALAIDEAAGLVPDPPFFEGLRLTI
jgi:hypothetical protein